jgi:glycosyltransferase involved in cell wall biosynthesis
MKLLKKNKYDIALSYLETPNFYLSVSKLFTRTKTIFITSERNSTPNKNGRLLLQKKITHTLSDYLICNSYHEATLWKKILPKKQDAIGTIYNGVQLERFEFVQKRTYRSKKMLCVASVIPRKNALYLVQALSILKRKYQLKVHITWVGQFIFNDEEGTYYKEVCQALKESDIQDQWTWVKPTKEIEQFYKQYDALILTSKKEGVPNVICESLSMGLPVFAGDILDHAYLLSEPNRGFLFDLENPETLSLKMLNFYKLSQEELEQISINQRQFSEKELAISVMISNYDKLFKNLIQ